MTQNAQKIFANEMLYQLTCTPLSPSVAEF